MGLALKIDTDSNVPLFQQIIDGLELQILMGNLKPGDFLPSVREFALAHSLNPNTVSKAYQLLQSQGLIEAIRGLGLKVSPMASKDAEKRKAEILEQKVAEISDLASH